jgi:hypothetical protein
MPTPAEKLFNETFARNLRTLKAVAIFRQMVHLGIAAAAEAKAEETSKLYDELISSPQHEKLFTDRAGFRASTPKEKFVEVTLRHSLATSINSLNAATILFAHSMVDGAAFDYCRVTALHAPEDWEPDISNKQVPFSAVRGMPIEEIRAAKLGEVLKDLEMKSLKEKIDRLHARCQPPAGQSLMSGYAFDLDRIIRIDRLRQDIVHGEALGQTIANADEEFDYMDRTCMYFMALVNFKYHLKLDPYSAMGLKREN